MSRSYRRRFWVLATILSTSTAFQIGPTGCGQYAAYAVLDSFNFCSILNCSSGTFFDLCEPVALLQDCPNVLAQGG